ncbi:ScbR family autoregulator-binding transcription factor [Streptomyces sp. NPDC002343]
MVKQPRSAQTREAVVRAAAEAFADHGYAGASLPVISSRAGVSAGALYFHFTSKDELAKEVEEAAVARVAALADRCRATGRSPLRLLATTMCRLVPAAASDPVVRAGFQLGRDASRKNGARLGEWWHTWVRELITEAHREGELAPDVRPEVATAAVVAATAGFMELATRHVDWADPRRLEEFWSFLLPRIAATP